MATSLQGNLLLWKYEAETYMVREVKEDELNELLELYLFLHEDKVPELCKRYCKGK